MHFPRTPTPDDFADKYNPPSETGKPLSWSSNNMCTPVHVWQVAVKLDVYGQVRFLAKAQVYVARSQLKCVACCLQAGLHDVLQVLGPLLLLLLGWQGPQQVTKRAVEAFTLDVPLRVVQRGMGLLDMYTALPTFRNNYENAKMMLLAWSQPTAWKKHAEQQQQQKRANIDQDGRPGKKDLRISNVRLENDQLEVHNIALIKLYTHSVNRLHKI